MNRKNRTVNLRRMGRSYPTGFVLLVCFLLTGCARNTYSVSSLPRQYLARATSDFSTLDLTAYAQPAPDEHEIRSGDRLKLALNSGIGGPEALEQWTVGVDEEGGANLPNIGRVTLAGLTHAEAEQTIAHEGIRRDVYLTPAVDLQVESRQENQIFVSGGVKTPGPLVFPEARLSLADVLVRVGGVTSEATGNITINVAETRQQESDQLTALSDTTDGNGITLNLASTAASELAAIQVSPGATVGVEVAGERSIQVIGIIGNRAVKLPAGRDLRMLEGLALAGGPTYSHWISNRIDIIRRVPGKDETIRIRASIREAKKDDTKNLLLAPNDIVSVEENVMSFMLSALGGLSGLTNAARYATVP